jgi:cytochrome P450 family 107 subfamily K polypeptide 1
VTFGFGIHFCIGAVLARMEGQLAFEALSSRFPSLELATDEVTFKPSAALRGPESLPVSFGPRQRR